MHSHSLPRLGQYAGISNTGGIDGTQAQATQTTEAYDLAAQDGITREDVFRDTASPTGHQVAALNAGTDSLFVDAIPPHPPRWLGYFAPYTTASLEGLFAASASAVLLVEASDRFFAITFGQGRHLLDQDNVEEDFGLRVVLNTVAPDQLKSVDAKTIDETTVHTRRDVSRNSAFSAFGLDPSRDLLRALTGTPQDTTLAERLTGADALGVQTRAKVPELTALAERLLTAFEADDYKEHFDFIDHLRPEKNTARIAQLEQELVDALATRDIDDVHLAAPETLDWIDVAGFRLSTGDGEVTSDPSISGYLDSHPGGGIDIKILKADRLEAVRASDDQTMASWPIYRCIVYQVEFDGSLYVLSAGQWFRVDLDYKTKVYADVEALERLDGLPNADPGTDEAAYNRKAAEAIGGLCLDRKFVFDGGPDKIEICDILKGDGTLIHVKPRGSSSTLSHLFMQGLNSAERLLLDQDFRSAARAITTQENAAFANVLPEGRPQAPDHQIAFVVITRSKRATPLTLPFFSVVSLRAAARQLDGFGFRVAVAAVYESH
jgi:uncharacterized protein (TIGR04141 family)